jgi:hypothetical protein
MVSFYTKHAEQYQRKAESEDLTESDLDMAAAQSDLLTAQQWKGSTCVEQN